MYVGKAFEVVFEHDGDRKSASWTLGRKDVAFWTNPEGLAHIAGIPGTLLGLLLAWLITFRRPDVATARLGALLFASGASASLLLTPPPGFPAFLSSLPFPLAALPLAAVIGDATAGGPVAMMFLASFPRRNARSNRTRRRTRT